MKTFIKSKAFRLSCIGVALAIGIGVFLNSHGSDNRSLYASKTSIRQLTPDELSKLGAEGINGNCVSAYQVGLHHLYFSMDDSEAIKFFRIAAKCQYPDAYASLITLLASRPEFDAEVDHALSALVKLDPEMAKSAEIEISHRRQERSRK